MKRSLSGAARPANVRPATATSVLHPPLEDDDGDGPFFELELSEASASGSDDSYVIRARRGDGDGDGDLFYSCHASLLFTPSSKPHLPSAILRSATKLRVFILRFKKPKSPPNEEKRTARFLFSSSRSSTRSAKLYAEESIQSPAPTSSADEKRNVIGKYLNKIKPLYGRRASKRRSGELTAGDLERSGNRSLRLRMGTRGLRKSRSESAAVRSPPPRCDDSLTQREDGIQSAIAHCKRSFSADNR